MSESTHTPGPWITDKSHQREWPGIAVWSDDVVIAHVIDDQHGNAEANAKLIAAAPDLLRAILPLRDHLILNGETNIGNDWKNQLERARAAIAKAGGDGAVPVGSSNPEQRIAELEDALDNLVRWEEYMGGFEGRCWDQAKAVLAGHEDHCEEDSATVNNTDFQEDIAQDCLSYIRPR